MVCDLVEPPGRLSTSLQLCADFQEVRISGKIREGRYQYLACLAEPSGRNEDIIQAFPCLIASSFALHIVMMAALTNSAQCAMVLCAREEIIASRS